MDSDKTLISLFSKVLLAHSKVIHSNLGIYIIHFKFNRKMQENYF